MKDIEYYIEADKATMGLEKIDSNLEINSTVDKMLSISLTISKEIIHERNSVHEANLIILENCHNYLNRQQSPS